MNRANPFDDLSDFTPSATAKPVEAKTIARIAEEQGFPSRQPSATAAPAARPPQRRYTTGRNQQINVKATPETIARFHRLADTLGTARSSLPLGEVLEMALDALEARETQRGLPR